MNKYTSSNNKSHHLRKKDLVTTLLSMSSAACVHNVINFTCMYKLTKITRTPVIKSVLIRYNHLQEALY